MKTRFRLFLVGLAAFVFAAGFQLESAAQKRDAFSHASAAHKKIDCSSCHKNPTTNWVTARSFPDVADFPGHASCINCHRRDFFAGNRPAICAGCHVSPGPRGAARFPFPVRSRSHEFSTIFPHNVHQDVIASKQKRSDIAVAHFINASFRKAADDPPQFNNCAICHQTRADLPQIAARVPSSVQPLVDAATESFVPAAGFFKNMPSGHASCFTCHFQGVKPAGNNCASCHALTTPYAESAVARRYSAKFDHRQKDHALRDCMTCHVRISQNADLKTLVNADVPFMTCVQCHSDKLSEEMGKRAETLANRQPAFQCTYCHTTAVGRFPVPPSHDSR